MAREIVIKIEGQGGQYTAEIDRIIERNRQLNRHAIEGAERMNRMFLQVQHSLSGIGATLAGLVSIGALTALAKQAIDTAGRIQDLADQTKLSAQLLSGLKSPIEQAGGTLDEFANGIVRLQKSLVDSQGKQDAFALRMRDLLQLSSDPERFLEGFAKKLAAIENPAERTAFVLEAASRGGAKLGPIFELIAREGLDKFRNSANAMSNETIRRLDELGDAATDFKNNLINAAAAGVASFGDLTGAVRGFGTALGQTIAFIVEHKDKILLLGAAVAGLTGHWVAAAGALAAYLGLSSQYRGDLGRLNALNEKQLALEQQLLVVEEARRRGQRSGLASDEVYNRMLNEQTRIAQEKQELIDIIRQTNDVPITIPPIAGLGPSDAAIRERATAIRERATALEDLQKRVQAVRNEIANPAGDANLKALQEIDDLGRKYAKFNDSTMRGLIATIRQHIEAKIVENRELERNKAIVEQVTALNKFLADSEAAEIATKNEARAEIDREFQLKQQLLDLDIDRLRAAGLSGEADRKQLENLIKLNEERKRALEIAAQEGRIFRTPGEASIIDKQTAVYQTRLEQIGKATVDIGRHIGDTLNDIFTALITGTLKSVDISKAALATVGRIATDIFQQAITRKLSFEIQLFNNLRGLPGQATAALSAGAVAVPANQQSGIFQTLFGGGGLFTTPIGIGTSTLGSLGLAGLGGFGLSALLGGSGLQHGLSALGGIGGSLLGGLSASSLGLAAPVFATVGEFLGGGISSLLGGGALGATIGGLAADFLLPGIGSILGFLLGGLFKQIPNPSVWVQTIIKFYYDAAVGAFNAFNQATIVRFRDIKGAKAEQVLQEHQRILDAEAGRYVNLLNTFPQSVHDSIVPLLETANEWLNRFLGAKKYSEGGSRNLQRELEDLRTKEAPAVFFVALRQAIGAGIGGLLGRAGLDLGGVIGEAFGPVPEDQRGWRRGLVNFGTGLGIPANPEDAQKFLEAIQRLVSFSGSLAGISPRGITPFVTEADRARLEAELQSVLEARGNAFTTAVDDMLERIQPIADFLSQSVQQASELFGRGMIAALEAANSSQAQQAFMQTLGEGTKQIIFQGITEAFIASAQFTDLLAPIQQTIREFTQQAIETGEVPDINAFRRAILPGIEDISTRAETLRPLIEELHRLGIDVTDALRALTGVAQQVARQPANFTINLPPGWQGTDAEVRDLAGQLDNLLRGQLNPS
jgi:hypothetical protein